MVTDSAERFQEALGVLSRFEPSHQPFTLSRRPASSWTCC
jgi:hypothetical protein